LVKIIGREMNIPKNEENVGFVGDHNMEAREFEIADSAMFDFNFKLDLKVNDHTDIADLEKRLEEGKLILKWTITKNTLQKNGILFAQIRAFKETGESWHSEKGQFWIGEGTTTEYARDPIPSEFIQIEQQVTQVRNETISAKDVVLLKSNDVMTNTQIIAQNTATVIQKAVEVAQDALEAATNTETSLLSAQQSTQALSDLLTMLGSDVATLTGGKLTPSQIPAIAVTDTFVVNSQFAMLALTAETGDVCIRTDESKTYILQGSNPTILENWQHLKTPTNYADTAGHATTADEATNATMINGHRVVYMTQAQYDVAVKDPETVYMVGV